MSFFENTRKPTGFGGKVMVNMMNLFHAPLADWGILCRFGREKRDRRVGQQFAGLQPGLYAGLPRPERPVSQRLFPLPCPGR